MANTVLWWSTLMSVAEEIKSPVPGGVRLFDYSRVDWVTPTCLLLLGTTSVFFIYSAQIYSGGSQWKMQLVWLTAGAMAYLGVASVNYKALLDKGHWIYVLGIVALIIVETPLGYEKYGSRRWIDLKVFKVQPTEAAKIGTLILCASILARSRIGTLRESLEPIGKVFLTTALPILLIFLQPDLGSTLVFPPMVFTLLFLAKIPMRFFAFVFCIIIPILGVISVDMYRFQKHLEATEQTPLENLYGNNGYGEHSIVPLKDYQRNRILAFVAPDVADPQGIGVNWNRAQSLIAVGSGGLAGKGLGQSTQAKLGYLPSSVAHNDFIYSVLAEEKGFIGGALVLCLLAAVVGNGFRVALQARDRFGMLLAAGVSVIFMVHIFINIGMTLGITPVTGLPLPMLSYGGSFVISCCVLQGLLQSIYRFRKDFS